MHLRTIQATALKAIFEVLKDIINDVNVYFDSQGVHILTLDTARVTLVHMTLGSDNFEEYDCPVQITAGLNMTNVYKLLKSISGADILTMDVTDRDYMDIRIENATKKSVTNFKLKLLDINEDMLDLPDVNMNTVTTIPSVDLQRIARDMGNLSNEIDIWRYENKMEVSCLGDFANQQTVIEFPEDIGNCRTGGTFSLKYINLFTKATNMCSSVQLMQDSTHTDMPIVFRYTIANLGDIKFYLAPKVE
jgi:proliferating cell nuclear antigen